MPFPTFNLVLPPVLRSGLAVVIGAIVLVAVSTLGVSGATSDALGAMGFDPDRAALIAALIAEIVVVAVAVAAVGRTRGALLVGVAAFWVQFLPTFARETSAALAVPAATGQFDPAGWLITLGTQLVVAALLAIATALLVGAARATILAAVVGLRSALRRPIALRRAGTSAGVIVAVVLAITALPVFGDMVNYDPGARMVAGARSSAVIVPSPAPSAADGPSPSPEVSTSLVPGLFTAAPSPGSVPPLSSAKPWLAWLPTGTGTVHAFKLPAPWTGGTSTTAPGWVYTPPGYASGNRRYPVVYQFPFGIDGFEKSVHIATQLDALITSGAIPPLIMVFGASTGGPFADSECINSADGREQFETYASSTMVQYIDRTYRTLAKPSARSLIGYSAGGYCASMLLLRHLDVFSVAIVFSGYFEAGLRNLQTPNSWRPYGGDQALIAATSPINLVKLVPGTSRSSIFFALSASPTEAFYGPQLDGFAAALRANSIPHSIFPAVAGHSWSAVRDQLPTMLETLAARMAATQMFGP